jgi:hypothetical protein
VAAEPTTVEFSHFVDQLSEHGISLGNQEVTTQETAVLMTNDESGSRRCPIRSALACR